MNKTKYLIVTFLFTAAALIYPLKAAADNSDSSRAKLGKAPAEAIEQKAAFETQVNVSGGGGELSEADYREVSRLASRLMFHVGEGSYAALADNAASALKEVRQANKLASIIRSMIPTSTVETLVKNRDGKVVYRDKRNEQNDTIPIFRGSTPG